MSESETLTTVKPPAGVSIPVVNDESQTSQAERFVNLCVCDDCDLITDSVWDAKTHVESDDTRWHDVEIVRLKEISRADLGSYFFWERRLYRDEPLSKSELLNFEDFLKEIGPEFVARLSKDRLVQSKLDQLSHARDHEDGETQKS